MNLPKDNLTHLFCALRTIKEEALLAMTECEREELRCLVASILDTLTAFQNRRKVQLPHSGSIGTICGQLGVVVNVGGSVTLELTHLSEIECVVAAVNQDLCKHAPLMNLLGEMRRVQNPIDDLDLLSDDLFIRSAGLITLKPVLGSALSTLPIEQS